MQFDLQESKVATTTIRDSSVVKVLARSERSIGPGTYNTEVEQQARSHRFSNTQRFTSTAENKHKALLDKLKRQNGMVNTRAPTPDLSQSSPMMRQERLRRRMETRNSRLRQSRETRQKEEWLRQDKIINKEKYKEMERIRQEEEVRLQAVKAGWHFFVGLASRAAVMESIIKKVKYEEEVDAAARCIQTMVKGWMHVKRGKRENEAAKVITRQMLRYTGKARMLRRRAAQKILSTFVREAVRKKRWAMSIRKWTASELLQLE